MTDSQIMEGMLNNWPAVLFAANEGYNYCEGKSGIAFEDLPREEKAVWLNRAVAIIAGYVAATEGEE